MAFEVAMLKVEVACSQGQLQPRKLSLCSMAVVGNGVKEEDATFQIFFVHDVFFLFFDTIKITVFICMPVSHELSQMNPVCHAAC